MSQPTVLGGDRPLELAAFDHPAYRVHPAPHRLPERRSDGPGPNRFDDPDNVYVVRYLADSLRGSLLEAMARLRPESRENEQWRHHITGVDESNEPDEHELHRTAVAEWLAVQRVATIRPVEAPGRYVDLTDPKNLDTLSHHPRVATHLDPLHQDGWIDRPLLDGTALRVSGPQGRALTQALSRAVYDAQPRPDGIRYRSRLDDAESCWALFGHVDVTINTNESLKPDDSQHRAGVVDIAALWRIPLPSHWQ